MRRTALLALLVVLAGCLGQPLQGGTAATSPSTDERTGTPEPSPRTTDRPAQALDPADCTFHRELPRETAETASLPDSFDRLPAPPDDLTHDAVVRVAVHHRVVVLNRSLRNRTDVHDYGIGPGTTFTAAAVTNRSATGACVVVRVPYWVEPTENSVADRSVVATYFVNRTVVTRDLTG